MPKEFGDPKVDDPNWLLPLVLSPGDILIAVGGDPGRDHCFICAENGRIGYPTSTKIELPANWKGLLQESKKK